MSDRTHSRKPLRVLLSEGNSTSAREAVTVLGLTGHHVEICDPNPHSLSWFSRFVRKVHRCPGLRDDPAGFLAFVEHLLTAGKFDVLLPIHEQGYVFSRVAHRLGTAVGLALPEFASYRRAHNKADFSRLLTELGLPQPATRIVRSPDELRAAVNAPCVVKTAVGTASRGVWLARDDAGVALALRELSIKGGFANDVLVQDFVPGATEKAQAVFAHGRMIAFHAYRQIASGAGGGDAIKQSVERGRVRDDLAVIGRHLQWHGALSVDLILSEADGRPFYIDCNPRLVDPMSGYLAGIDLVDALLGVSLGEAPATLPSSREGVRTHQAMQALLGRALSDGTRRDILRECRDLLFRRNAYADSAEELTPVRSDWLSAVPLGMTALSLLSTPRLAQTLVTRGWGEHLLGPQSIARIQAEIAED
jgi:predicted ATP-grasp superfamily ATP-dependent carboligase